MTRLDLLTPREWLVIEAIARGLQDKEIAQVLGISIQTVKNHNSSIYHKLGAETRIDVLRIVGWLRVPGERPVEYLSARGMVPV